MKFLIFRTPALQEWRHLFALYPADELFGFGVFGNKPGVIPGRWGFCFFGFEIGSRNPSKFGCFLKRIGLWPW